jgi:hypothetical protein
MINFNASTIRTINPSEGISDSLSTINNNYSTLYLWTSALQQKYDGVWQPIIDYYNQYVDQLQNSLTLVQSYSANWDNFQTIVESNSSKWLQPFTIFYPTLIQDTLTQNDIDSIKTWLGQYFPIRNSDGTLNYVENQKFIVSCYIYSYDTNNQINIKDQAYSYAVCATQSGTIYAHCKTLVTGGWVHCSNTSYYCDATIDFYPSKHVDCWYASPYLYNVPEFGQAITDTTFTANNQSVRGQIMANISMNYLDRNETKLQNLIFNVIGCDWNYGGTL